MHVELLSRKYYSVVSEITVHTWNMVVLGRTASLYKKMHIHQEPVNLTWFGKRVPAAALKWSGGHKASARAHTEWSVTPQGKSGQTRREKATRRGRQRLGFCGSHIQAIARTVGSPQKRGQTPGTILPQSLLGVARCRPLGIHCSLHDRDKVHVRCFQLHSLWHVITTVRRLTRWSFSGFQN